MQEIKTITDNLLTRFDLEVNDALKEGWELVRRECFVTGSDHAITLYAELKRGVLPESECPELDGCEEEARWQKNFNPGHPYHYHCSKCGFKSTRPYPICPNCKRLMADEVEVMR